MCTSAKKDKEEEEEELIRWGEFDDFFFFYVIGYRRVSLMTYRQVLCWNRMAIIFNNIYALYNMFQYIVFCLTRNVGWYTMNGATSVTTSEEHQHQHQQPQNDPSQEHPRSPTSPLSIRHGELISIYPWKRVRIEFRMNILNSSETVYRQERNITEQTFFPLFSDRDKNRLVFSNVSIIFNLSCFSSFFLKSS